MGSSIHSVGVHIRKDKTWISSGEGFHFNQKHKYWKDKILDDRIETLKSLKNDEGDIIITVRHRYNNGKVEYNNKVYMLRENFMKLYKQRGNTNDLFWTAFCNAGKQFILKLKDKEIK